MLAALPRGGSALGGDPSFIARAGRREKGGNHLYRNLNKQKINIHHFYKLQHYGTVECINYTGRKRIYSIYQGQL